MRAARSATSRPSVAALYHRGLAAYLDDRLPAAERDLAAVVARRARHAGALHFLGLIAQRSGRTRRALRLLRQSVAVDSKTAMYRLNLGNLFFELGRTVEAFEAWELAGRLDDRCEDAFTNIGLTAAECGDHERAAAAFARVTEIDPDSAAAFRRLARSLRALGRSEEARRAAARARELSLDPRALARFGVERVKADRVEEGLLALRRAVRLAPRDAEVHAQLASVLSQEGGGEEALRAFNRALALDPHHGTADFMATALAGGTPARPPAGYVVGLFDSYADHFDERLVKCLGYKGPALVWRGVQRVLASQEREPRGLRVLDAGCGTGLAAAHLRGAARRLVGVDLSPRMIGRARARNAYDELIVGDLVAELKSTRERFDLIFSADVFIYVGNLGRAFAAAARALRPGGLLAFSVEAAGGDGYALTHTGRYAHSTTYVRRVAAASGLVVRHAGTGTVRYERGAPVKAAVIVLEKV
jgi:predicted TPR repeat methyltransferase